MKSLWKLLLITLLSQRGEVGGEEPTGGEPAPSGDPAPSLLGDDPAPGTPAPTPGETPSPADHQTQEQMKALWGDMADKIEWPEGTPDDVKLSHSIKPFVGKDGKINQAELAKSYVYTKKKVGEKGVQVPTENSPQEEWDEYFKNAGWSPEIEGYKVAKPEGSEITDESLDSLKKLFHENRVPQKQAQQILNKLDESTKTALDGQSDKIQQEIEEGVTNLKKEWGDAFDSRIGLSKKVLKEIGSPELQKMMAEDPTIGSNPHVIKFLHGIGEKMYGEDQMPGKGLGDMSKTPAQASEEINMILGNSEDPYNKPQHPGHKDRVKHVQQLFAYKNAR